MFRQNNYTEGSFYSLIPLSRQAVVPGQSVGIDLNALWETPAFSRNVLTGGMWSVMAFYVPFRLVWDEWVEFISDPESTAVVPTSTVQMPQLFEKATVPMNTFGRRAYKLVYNQYFGSQDYGGAAAPYWYGDITADADVSVKVVRTTDQFLGKIFPRADAPDEVFEAPVTGTVTSGTINPGAVAGISLNEFRQRMKDARSDRRSNLTGDKYVDAMRRMGVALDWKIQNAPEFLGSASGDFSAKETRASYTPADPLPAGSAVTGRAYARFNENVAFRSTRKFFAEHGLVITLLVVRPFVWPASFRGPLDQFQNKRDNFFLGDNQTGVETVDPVGLGTTGETYYQSRFSYLRAGQNMTGVQSASPWFVDTQYDDIAQLVWPNPTIPQDSSLSSDLAVSVRYRAQGPTPVRSVTY